MRLVVDSPTHKFIEKEWPYFASDKRNVRLGLATDGISPFGTMRSKYSMWPVILMNYNIPPWLAIKKGHIFLSLLIPGNIIHSLAFRYLYLIILFLVLSF